MKCIIFPLAADSWLQSRKAAYLAWELPTLKATWTFDYMNNAKSRENLIFPIFITNKVDSVIIYIRRFFTC